VKLVWSREEDMQHDFFRPISMCKLSAGLDESGQLQGLHIRISGQSINAFLQPGVIKDNRDTRQVQGLYREPGDAQFGYSPPNLLIEYAMRNSTVPVGPWRGVNTNQNAVYLECFMEEVARAAGKDSLEFRRALMQNHPKHLAVLNAAAEKATGQASSCRRAPRHRAIHGLRQLPAATAEVSVSPEGKVKSTARFSPSTAATPSTRSRSPRRSKLRRLRPERRLLRRDHHRERSRSAVELTTTRPCVSPRCRKSRPSSSRPTTSGAASANRPSVVTPAVLNAIKPRPANPAQNAAEERKSSFSA
jgi:hypothetical protein